LCAFFLATMKPLLFKDIRPVHVPVPPVTGLNNSSAPYANSFDASRVFRERTGSGAKRPRRDGQDELLNSVYDLTRDFPPPTVPDRPALDVAAIKSVLVEAAAMAESLKPVLSKDDSTEESKAVFNMFSTLVNLVGLMIEKGIEPLSSVVTGVSGGPTGRGYAAAARRLANPPSTTPKPPIPGKKELVEALDKAEKEAILFGADLGPVSIANRGVLNVNLTTDIQKKVMEKTADKPTAVTTEALRVVEDALSCVENIDFMGPRSKMTSKGDGTDFCTMPIKLSFADKDSRINFERSMRDHTGLRASQSLPQPIRREMAVFRRALEERYNNEIIMVRPDSRHLEFSAFRKQDGDKKWTQCCETHPIPIGIMLPGFKESTRVTLPEVANNMEAEDGAIGGD
jgi:hypothetical protein